MIHVKHLSRGLFCVILIFFRGEYHIISTSTPLSPFSIPYNAKPIFSSLFKLAATFTADYLSKRLRGIVKELAKSSENWIARDIRQVLNHCSLLSSELIFINKVILYRLYSTRNRLHSSSFIKIVPAYSTLHLDLFLLSRV